MQRSAGTVVDARTSLAMWLRGGRMHKGLTLEAVAKVTKIQPRILEKLESGKLDGLPADVFVRGFVRSFAKCVGLDEHETLLRYAAAAGAPSTASTSARAFVESMAELAPAASARARVMTPAPAPVVEPAAVEPVLVEVPASSVTAIEVVGATDDDELEIEIEIASEEAVPAPVVVANGSSEHAVANPEPAVTPPSKGGKKKRSRRSSKSRKGNKHVASSQAALPGAPAPESVPDVVLATTTGGLLATTTETVIVPGAPAIDTVEPIVTTAEGSAPIPVPPAFEAIEVALDDEPAIDPSERWAPKMPTVVAPTVPWRRPAIAATASRVKPPVVPSLVIDDADPEGAEREREERKLAKDPGPRRSFLPPILLDREDRTARQGGLTLAVIILLIAATLTLSYLMRRPSSSGDGVTRTDDAAPELIVVV